MRGRLRRHRQTDPELNITAFMNLMVALIPFLLITAVFSRITILDLQIPSVSNAPTETPPPQELPIIIEITVRQDAIIVADNRGFVRRLDKPASGYDYKTLSELLIRMKDRLKGIDPNKRDISILLEPNIAYETLVTVMDTVRAAQIRQGTVVASMELFPDISIGDAPAPQ
jgi:biopolymer transport protein ExbD